ncbi:hypothetical protein BZA77DRAFT_5158 [Pyronema omphalodes]|nr:hypothetical protein BZA77DRAFT_5158 [Pyronema omphalodes]
MAEWQFEQTKAGAAATCDHAAEIDLIVQQRVVEATAAIEANVEAQVQQRLAERSASAPGNGETVNTAQPVPAPADVDPAQATAMVSQLSEEEIDARVNARVEELLPARVDAIVAERIVAKEQAVDQRIRTAQAKFAEYKASAVKKAVEEAEARFKVERDEYQTKISGLEAEISRLGMLIQQLRAKIAELEASKNTVKEESESTGIQQEDLDAALAQKEEEHQAAIEALKSAEAENIDKAKDELRVEIQAEILSAQLAIDAMTPEEGAAAVNKEREKLKTVISRNVEHRLSKEKEKWLQEIATERETIVNSKVQAVLAEKVTELEAKMQEREAALKLEMEKAKDAVRAESVMRSKVQINMLERKNKQLEEKVKALEGGQPSVPATPAAAAASHAAPASAQAPTPIVTPATTATTAAPQVLQTGIRRPSAIGTPASVPSTRPEPPTAGQIQAAQQAAIAAAEQTIAGTPPNAQQTQQRRQDSQGTGPQALRQLRGALAGTGIPRGGMAAGRGRGGIPQPGSIAGAPVTQIPATNTFIGVPGATPPGILNPFAGATQQPPQVVQGQQQATRGGGIPRGRGYAGRGRGGTQHVQTAGMQQQAQQNASSPTRGVMNPGARQFVPGGKRGREGEGDDGADGKRARNSTGGAPPPAQQ